MITLYLNVSYIQSSIGLLVRSNHRVVICSVPNSDHIKALFYHYIAPVLQSSTEGHGMHVVYADA